MVGLKPHNRGLFSSNQNPAPKNRCITFCDNMYMHMMQRETAEGVASFSRAGQMTTNDIRSDMLGHGDNKTATVP